MPARIPLTSPLSSQIPSDLAPAHLGHVGVGALPPGHLRSQMGSLPELAPQEMRLFSGWPETSSLGGQCPRRGRVSRVTGTTAPEEIRGWGWQSLQGGGSFCLTSPPCREQVHVPSVLWAIVPHLYMWRLDSVAAKDPLSSDIVAS